MTGVQTCARSEEHTSELQSHDNLVCRLLLEKKKILRSGRKRTGLDSLHTRRSDACRCDASVHAYDVLPSPQRRSADFSVVSFFFFFNDTAPPEIYPLSLHDALPI